MRSMLCLRARGNRLLHIFLSRRRPGRTSLCVDVLVVDRKVLCTGTLGFAVGPCTLTECLGSLF